MGPGGDKHSAQAKLDRARREQQIVALALRGIPFHEIGRQLGIGRISAFKAFRKALHQNTDRDIQTHHRIEIAKLDMEEANVWRTMDSHRDNSTSAARGCNPNPPARYSYASLWSAVRLE
jgi:hypothetical protein